MLMNAWMQIQAVIPAASSAPNVSGAPSEVRMPEVAEGEEQHDHEAGAEQPELLADDREDEVVRGVGQEQPAGQPALAEARARRRRRAPSAR